MQKKYSNKFIRNIFVSFVVTLALLFGLVNSLYRILRTLIEVSKWNEWTNFVIEKETLILFLFLIVGISLFVLVFYLLQRDDFQFIDRISTAMKQIADGNLDTKISIQGDDEFSEMAFRLNEMASSLKNYVERERESEKEKNEFITSIAHDLRTPLTSIIGYLDLVVNHENLQEDKKREYIRISYDKSMKLKQLTDEFFHFTKMGHKEVELKLETIDMVKLMEQLLNEFYPQFSENKLTFELKTNVDTMMIEGDPNLLVRVFENLINNAIKYGYEGKRVDVLIDGQETYCKISVVNYGKVIPAEELPLIFQKFYRVEQSRSRQTGGTGLGLAIAKEVVEKHGGNIHVSSDRNGTRFVTKLYKNIDRFKETFANESR